MGAAVRTGKAQNLAERRNDHARDPMLGKYRFQVESRTDDPDTQWGLEQILYDRYPETKEVNGGFNKYRPFDPAKNPKADIYMQAARDFLASLEGD
jgi:hypothetical protein